MGEIMTLDKSKADELSTLGYKYIERKTHNETVYVFVQTQELMKELGSRFESGSFFMSKTLKL